MRKKLIYLTLALAALAAAQAGIAPVSAAPTFPALPPAPACGARCTNEGENAMCPDYMSQPWRIIDCSCHNGYWVCPAI